MSVGLITAVFGTSSVANDVIVPADPVEMHMVRATGSVSRILGAPIAFYQTLKDQVEHGSCELIHDHGLWLPNHGAAAFAAKRSGVPLVVSPRGMLEPWALGHNRWKKRLAWWVYQRRVLKQATLFHATAEAEAKSLRRLGFDQPIAVIPNGVKVPGRGKRERRPGANRTALFLSRLHPKKGLPMLIEAWAELRPEGWELILVGPSEGGHRGELERQARQAGLEDVVTFAGSVSDDEKWSYYDAADLFILPTYSENFGIVVAEALAAGVPVITTTGAPWEELESRNCGWWVDPDTGALAGALREAVGRSQEERLAMGRRGRKLVEERYSWEGVARQMEAAYRWLLGRGSQPSCVRLA